MPQIRTTTRWSSTSSYPFTRVIWTSGVTETSSSVVAVSVSGQSTVLNFSSRCFCSTISSTLTIAIGRMHLAKSALSLCAIWMSEVPSHHSPYMWSCPSQDTRLHLGICSVLSGDWVSSCYCFFQLDCCTFQCQSKTRPRQESIEEIYK